MEYCYFLIITKLYILASINYLMSDEVISKEQFHDLYINKELTTFQIAEKFNCSQTTIWKKLKEFNIKPRLSGTKRVKITKNELADLYVIQKFSTWQIEKKLNIPRGTVYRKLKEYGIKIRDLSTANIIYPKSDFSGDLIEKAYLIGFRIGDLGVRKQYLNSKTICVASGSTIPEQIKLIKNLFKKYSKVWIKKTKRGKINIQVILNQSFDFLLDKTFPKWIARDKRIFFSFLAGFTDAEGAIRISNKMAYFSLGNYDKTLLYIIHANLNRFGIKCNVPKEDNRKGTKNTQGYRYTSNYWSLRVHDKENLLKLIASIKPYIKHELKKRDLNNAIENINYRNRRNNDA